VKLLMTRNRLATHNCNASLPSSEANANTTETFTFLSPVGPLEIKLVDQRIHQLRYFDTPPKPPQSDFANHVATTLTAYFHDATCIDDLPLRAANNEFQRRFRQALLDIPSGSTRTYGELATQLNSAAQAIGQACRHNPLPIIIPCHRVVAKTNLGGYDGSDAANQLKKQWLLDHEQHNSH
jgi:methylated-DNA-[protein]-cysteine S-methyltransferase